MARFLSLSRYTLRQAFISSQLYSNRYILQPQHVVPVRFYAKEAAPNETIKGIYSGVKDKLEIAIGVLRRKMIQYVNVITPFEGIGYLDSLRLKSAIISIVDKNYDPSEPGFETMLTDDAEIIYKKVGKILGKEIDKECAYKILRLVFTTKWQIKGIQDTRTLLLILMDILVEDFARTGVKVMLMDAVDKVEAEIKKPLMVNNHKGHALLAEEFKKMSPRLGLGMVKKDAREALQLVYF